MGQKQEYLLRQMVTKRNVSIVARSNKRAPLSLHAASTCVMRKLPWSKQHFAPDFSSHPVNAPASHRASNLDLPTVPLAKHS